MVSAFPFSRNLKNGHRKAEAYRQPPVIGGEHSITQALSHVTSTITATTIEDGASLSGNLSAAEGYAMKNVAITMGGVDITAASYDPDTHAINIASVSDDIAIIAMASQATTTMTINLDSSITAESGELPPVTLIYTNKDGNEISGTYRPSNGADPTHSWSYLHEHPIAVKPDTEVTIAMRKEYKNYAYYFQTGAGTKIGDGNVLTFRAPAAETVGEIKISGAYSSSVYFCDLIIEPKGDYSDMSASDFIVTVSA